MEKPPRGVQFNKVQVHSENGVFPFELKSCMSHT